MYPITKTIDQFTLHAITRKLLLLSLLGAKIRAFSPLPTNLIWEIHPLFAHHLFQQFTENHLIDKNIPRPSEVNDSLSKDICTDNTPSFKSSRSSNFKPIKKKPNG